MAPFFNRLFSQSFYLSASFVSDAQAAITRCFRGLLETQNNSSLKLYGTKYDQC